MKVDRVLKTIFYVTFSLLYVSGAMEYLFPSSFVLRVHGILGLWFLYFFGHFFRAHIWPSLRQSRHKKSGVTVAAILILLSLSVPFLYYLGNDASRDLTIFIHTYLGFLVVMPLGVHIYLAICRR